MAYLIFVFTTVVHNPKDATKCQGENVSFTCVVFISSGGVVSPVWLRNDVAVARHTIVTNQTEYSTAPISISSTVTISMVTALDDGAMYHCDILSLVTSDNATLTVVGMYMHISMNV